MQGEKKTVLTLEWERGLITSALYFMLWAKLQEMETREGFWIIRMWMAHRPSLEDGQDLLSCPWATERNRDWAEIHVRRTMLVCWGWTQAAHCFPSHPHSRQQKGTTEEVSSITRDTFSTGCTDTRHVQEWCWAPSPSSSSLPSCLLTWTFASCQALAQFQWKLLDFLHSWWLCWAAGISSCWYWNCQITPL